MRKRIKNIKGLTNKVGASLALLKHRVKNLFVIGAIEKVGLIAVLDSMVGSTPLNLGLNFHSFKAGLAETFTKIISAPADSFIGAKS
tara:strand:- start:78 stop:338 length:261 start_codon:yes stop_codon:yes gene_type:complete